MSVIELKPSGNLSIDWLIRGRSGPDLRKVQTFQSFMAYLAHAECEGGLTGKIRRLLEHTRRPFTLPEIMMVLELEPEHLGQASAALRKFELRAVVRVSMSERVSEHGRHEIKAYLWCGG